MIRMPVERIEKEEEKKVKEAGSIQKEKEEEEADEAGSSIQKEKEEEPEEV